MGGNRHWLCRNDGGGHKEDQKWTTDPRCFRSLLLRQPANSVYAAVHGSTSSPRTVALKPFVLSMSKGGNGLFGGPSSIKGGAGSNFCQFYQERVTTSSAEDEYRR